MLTVRRPPECIFRHPCFDGIVVGVESKLDPILGAQDYVCSLTEKPSKLRFDGATLVEFTEWKASCLERLGKLMAAGGLRRATPAVPDFEVMSKQAWHGLTRTELVFRNPDFDLVVPATVLTPTTTRANGAGVLCQHGHGSFGRLPVIGERDTPEKAEELERYDYDFGLQLALAGYTIIAIDLINFGSRGVPREAERDACDILGLWTSLFGLNMVSLMVSDIRHALSVLATWRGVDPERVGMTGLSLGSCLTMFASALDTRIRVAVASGSSNTYRDRIRARKGICGIQTLPGLLPDMDTPDVFAAVAPRPLQVQRGLSDPLLDQDAAAAGIDHIAGCYDAAGVPDRFMDHVFDGGHVYRNAAAIDWFDRWL